jgi:hypothetical protein
MSEHLYHIRKNEEEIGPLTLGQLRSMWSTGAIGVKTPYRVEGSETWGNLNALQAVLEGGTSPPPVPQMPPILPQSPPALPSTADAGKQSGTAARDALGCLVLIVGGVFVLFLYVNASINEKPSPKAAGQAGLIVQNSSESPVSNPASTAAPVASTIVPVAVEEPSNITWKEIDLFYFKSKNTDLQKAAKWKQYEGQIIEWSGRVSSISEGFFGGISMQVKMNPDTLVSDVMIKLKEGEEAKAMSYKEGASIKFKATLKDWGNFLGIMLADGEIIEK